MEKLKKGQPNNYRDISVTCDSDGDRASRDEGACGWVGVTDQSREISEEKVPPVPTTQDEPMLWT